ncbi:hypothetical protein CCACVL1_17999 [Corchorus capsularis]|uniref:Uncharacterized protein n=1 Tax=Corchorus capsularis TaxID=210143 RepID=A0A1R3HP09_COCAP|nr:hypothetical protein CCACVL1_17999 [Corchorus capsularis]
MAMEGYSEDDLGAAYDYLMANLIEGKAFLRKSHNLRTVGFKGSLMGKLESVCYVFRPLM